MYFKKASTHAENHKTKGSWIITAETVNNPRPFTPPQPHKPQKPFVSRFKTTSPLLELPYEIRSQIYDYVWDGAFIAMSDMLLQSCPSGYISAEMRVHSGIDFIFDFSLTGRRLTNVKPKFPGLLGKEFQFKWRKQKLQSTSLLRVCKQLSSEFSERVHETSIFGFSSSKKIRSFLDSGDRALQESLRINHSMTMTSVAFNKTLIKHICLEIPCYNEPRLTADRLFVTRYYLGWAKACAKLASETNLQNLAITARIPDSHPYRLALDEPWVWPLLEFSKANVKTAAIKLISPKASGISNKTLEAFCEIIRRKVLGWDDASALQAIESWKTDFPALVSNNFGEGYMALEKWNGLYDFEHERKVEEEEHKAHLAKANMPSVVAIPVIAMPKAVTKKPYRNKKPRNHNGNNAKQATATEGPLARNINSANIPPGAQKPKQAFPNHSKRCNKSAMQRQ